MLTLRRLLLLTVLTSVAALLASVALSQASSAPTGEAPATSSDSLLLSVPDGGSVDSIDNPNGSELYKVYRADGSLYATQERYHGASDSRFYGTDPKDETLVMGVFATFPATTDITANKDSARNTQRVSRSHRAHLPSSLKRVKASCGQDVRSYSGHTIPSTFKWWWKRSSTPTYLDFDLTLQNLRNAHAEWDSNDNWCGIADNSSVDFSYQGVTTLSYGRNNVNTVAWGDPTSMGCPEGYLACTARWYSGSDLIESDIRLNPVYRWRNGVYDNSYDIWHALAHEIGHQVGFNDIDNYSNVMRLSAEPSDISNRKLGKGDARGNNDLY